MVTVEKKKDEKEQDAVLVSVKDTGTGIDTEILPRLFTKFASKSLSGTGLGLFISKSIVEAHGAGYGQRITQMAKEQPFLLVCLPTRRIFKHQGLIRTVK